MQISRGEQRTPTGYQAVLAFSEGEVLSAAGEQFMPLGIKIDHILHFFLASVNSGAVIVSFL